MKHLPIAAALAVGASASAQSLVNVGDVVGQRLSPDGQYVVGSGGGNAFRWSQAMGVIDIGEDIAYDVTADGALVFGQMDDPLVGKNGAGFWDQGSGTWTALSGGHPGSGCDANYSVATGVSHDGSIASVNAWNACTLRASTWTSLSGVVSLPSLGTSSNRSNVMSGDGSTVGGWDRANDSTNRATIWINGGAPILVNVTASNPQGRGTVQGLSSDGRFAVGGNDLNGTGGFLYDSVLDTNLQIPMAGSPQPADSMTLYGVADDGKTAVGIQGNNFFGSPIQAVVWTESGGSQFLRDFLIAKGIDPGPGPLYAGRDLSPNGRHILVTRPSMFGFESSTFVAHLADPVMDLGGSTTGVAGNPELSIEGTFNPGTSVDMRLEKAGANFVTVLITAGSSIPVPFVGGTLHAFPLGITSGIFADANGEWEIQFNWPPNINSGVSLWFQTAVLFDPTPVDSIVLSNGLKVTTP